MANEVTNFNIGGVEHPVQDDGARQLIAQLQAAIDAITSGDTTTAIKTFQEVIDFLDGVTDDATLIGKLNELRTLINAKYTKPASGIPASDLANGVIPDVSGFATKSEMSISDVTGDSTKKKVTLKQGLDVDVVTEHQSLSSYATKSELSGKQDKLTGSDVLATINNTQVHYGESVNIIGQKGEKGDKGDTGNVQVDGNGNVLIYNGLDMRQTGAALDAYQGYVLALTKGTFAQAWVKSQFVTVPFCWVLSDTIDGNTILKPIWYVGNGVFVDAVGAEVLVEAESVPTLPTMTINGETPTSGAEVPKNTQVVITPAVDSVLYYKIGNGDYMKSAIAVTLTLTNEGTNVISAYCTNNKGNSTAVEVTLEVQGTPVPTFTPATSDVSRGGVVTIVGEAGGTLHYKIGDAATYTDVTGIGDAAPQATITIDGQNTDANRQITIHAYNTINGEDSGVVSKTYTMAALAAPSFSVESGTEFPADGGSVAISAAQGATIYYTTDGSTPTTSSTQYTSAVAVNSAMTIKAIAVDAYGSSDVASASYSVKLPKIIVTTNGATTMSLGDTDLTSIPLESGVNEISLEDINTLAGTSYASFADHVFASLSFGDKTKIVSFDGGGVKICSLNSAFRFTSTSNALTRCVGIVLAPIGETAASASYAFATDYDNVLSEVQISGEVNGSMENFLARNSSPIELMTVDLSGLSGTPTNVTSMFKGCLKIQMLDLTGLEINAAASMFRNCRKLATLKVKKLVSSGAVSNMFYDANSAIKTLIVTADEPFNAGWLADCTGLQHIYVPDNSVDAYKAHASWSAYADKIFGISNYNG